MTAGPIDERNSADEPAAWGQRLKRPDGGFAWPPRRPELKTPEPKPAIAHDDAATSRPGSTWSQVERTWLGLTAPPLEDRGREQGWVADGLGGYCPRCGQSAGRFEATGKGCSQCAAKRVAWSRVVRLGEYVPPLSQFVREVKFTAFRRLGVDLGKMLGRSIVESLREAVAEGEIEAGTRTWIVPVPTSWRRRVARGIDHSAVIAKAAAKEAGLPFVPLLARRHRPSQVVVTAAERRRNVSGTMRTSLGGWFRISLGWGKRGRDEPPPLMILVDDVTTTGATMREACRATRRAVGDRKASVWVAVVAVTPLRHEKGPERF